MGDEPAPMGLTEYTIGAVHEVEPHANRKDSQPVRASVVPVEEWDE